MNIVKEIDRYLLAQSYVHHREFEDSCSVSRIQISHGEGIVSADFLDSRVYRELSEYRQVCVVCLMKLVKAHKMQELPYFEVVHHESFTEECTIGQMDSEEFIQVLQIDYLEDAAYRDLISYNQPCVLCAVEVRNNINRGEE